MKKVSAILALSFYLIALSGITLTAHTCCGEQISVGFGSCMPFCSGHESNHCVCTPPALFSWCGRSQAKAIDHNIPAPVSSPVVEIAEGLQAGWSGSRDEPMPRLYPPPQSIYLQYNVFRI
jgi:hypothetical protein